MNMYNTNMYPYGYAQPPQVLQNQDMMQKSIDIAKDSKRKTNHNEAEKRRVRKINDTIDEIRDILAKDNIVHKKDKVSVLEASVAYIKQLLINRDRLSCRFGQLQSIIPTQQTKEETETQTDSNTPTTQVDYKSVWIYSSIPSIVVNMESGGLVKGNKQFHKHFGVPSEDDLVNLNLFELTAESDMPLLWSEVTYISNLKRKTTRSFVATYKRGTAEPLRCLTIMGNITDSSGNFTLLTLSLLPVTSHGIHENGFNMNDSMNKELLKTYEEPSLFNPHHFSFPTDPIDLLSLTNANADVAYNNLLLTPHSYSPEPSNLMLNNPISPLHSVENSLSTLPSSISMSLGQPQSINEGTIPLGDPVQMENNSGEHNLIAPTAHPDHSFQMQPPPLSMTLQAFNSLTEKEFHIPSYPMKENVDKSLNM